MAERYEFALPDGRAFGSDKTPEEIRQLYPEARIMTVVNLDDNGEFVSREPYKGKQPKAAAPVEDTPTTTTTKAPAKPAAKKAD